MIGLYKNIQLKSISDLTKVLHEVNALVLFSSLSDQNCKESQCESVLSSFSLIVGSLSGLFNQHQMTKPLQVTPMFIPITDYQMLSPIINDFEELQYLEYKGEPFFAQIRNGIYFSVVRQFEEDPQRLNTLLITLLSRQKKGFLQNLIIVDQQDEKSLFKNGSQTELRGRAKSTNEYCVFEGGDPDAAGEYLQVMYLVAEDMPGIQFYIREYDGNNKYTIWCVDKYYPKITYNLQSKFNYKNIVNFVFHDFKMRSIQPWSKELLKQANDFGLCLVLLVRDDSSDERSLYDFRLYEAQKLHQGKKDIIFVVSDMKEGFQKDFFDSIHIYDDYVPLLMILDFQKRFHMYAFPANSSYEQIVPTIGIEEPGTITGFIEKYDANQLKEHYRSENLSITAIHFPQAMMKGLKVTRINSQILEEHIMFNEEISIVFFCSFFYHQCITDFEAFKNQAESSVNKSRFYYMDSMANDISDPIKQVPCIRKYQNQNGVSVSKEYLPEPLKLATDKRFYRFIRDAMI